MDLEISKKIFCKLPDEYKALALKLNIMGEIKINFGGKENGK